MHPTSHYPSIPSFQSQIINNLLYLWSSAGIRLASMPMIATLPSPRLSSGNQTYHLHENLLIVIIVRPITLSMIMLVPAYAPIPVFY